MRRAFGVPVRTAAGPGRSANHELAGVQPQVLDPGPPELPK